MTPQPQHEPVFKPMQQSTLLNNLIGTVEINPSSLNHVWVFFNSLGTINHFILNEVITCQIISIFSKCNFVFGLVLLCNREIRKRVENTFLIV